MEGSNKATIINHRECIGSIRWDYIHDPYRIINQGCSETSIYCIHVHYVSYFVSPKLRDQLLVVRSLLFPLTVVMFECTITSMMKHWNPFWCNVQSLRPLRNGWQTGFLKLRIWNYNTGAKWSIPCRIRFKAVVTFRWIGISNQLIITIVVLRLLPYSNVTLCIEHFKAQWSQQFLQLLIIWSVCINGCVPSTPPALVVDRWTRQDPKSSRTKYPVNFKEINST